jgi:8-oxo-dGTP pyrophosphatase MutT (NUDIX family)
VPYDPDDRLRQIRHALAGHRPWRAAEAVRAGPAPDPAPQRRRASVALVVRPGEWDLELLLIKRAVVTGDPWSGHMALPGGRRDPSDRSGLETAVRETREEVGLDLSHGAAYLGRLDDVRPRRGAPTIVVSPYVFAAPGDAEPRLNHEVALALWVPLAQVSDPASATEHLHPLESGDVLRFPAIAYRDHLIWGITHRIIDQFLDLARTGRP